jgi:hypothetical protein
MSEGSESEESPVCPIRGAIKAIITTSTDNLVAGDNFSIFITIQNPFERMLIINSVTTSFPTEFIDLNPQQLLQSNSSGAALNVSGHTSIWNRFGISRLKVGVPGTLEVELQPTTSVARDISYSGEGEPTPLQPGNSTLRTFTIRTRQNIGFKPATYRFNIQIEYVLDGCRNLDTIEHIVNIRASLISILVGAAIGGGSVPDLM